MFHNISEKLPQQVLGDALGSGNFGIVHKARVSRSTWMQNVAAKFLYRVDASAQPTPDAQRIAALEDEIKVIARLKEFKDRNDPGSQNVVGLVGCIEWSDDPDPMVKNADGTAWMRWSTHEIGKDALPYPCLLMECSDRSNLRDYLRSRRDPTGIVDAATQVYMKLSVFQIAQGVEFLHKHLVVHRDLAARNILRYNNNVVKIGDFGLARFVKKKTAYTAGTRPERASPALPWPWTDPHARDRNQYGTPADMYSFGVLLFEIGTLAASPLKVFEASKNTPALKAYTSTSWNELEASDKWKLGVRSKIRCQAKLCWNADPRKRPTAEDMVEAFRPKVQEQKRPDYDDEGDGLAAEEANYVEIQRCIETVAKKKTADARSGVAAAEQNLKDLEDKHKRATKAQDSAYHALVAKDLDALDALKTISEGQRNSLKLTQRPIQPKFDKDPIRSFAVFYTLCAQQSFRELAFGRLEAIVRQLNVEFASAGYKFELAKGKLKLLLRAVDKAKNKLKKRRNVDITENEMRSEMRAYIYSTGVPLSHIVDILRATIKVTAGGLPAVATAAKRVAESTTSYTVVKHKNTLAPESGRHGYRDYKMCLQPAGHEWIFELQIIPVELYNAKDHDAFKELRAAEQELDNAKCQRDEAAHLKMNGYHSPPPIAEIARTHCIFVDYSEC